MFSTGKNLILNTFEILCMPQNFWPRKGPEYLYQLFKIFPQADNLKAFQLHKFTFNSDFMMSRELILLWPEIT